MLATPTRQTWRAEACVPELINTWSAALEKPLGRLLVFAPGVGIVLLGLFMLWRNFHGDNSWPDQIDFGLYVRAANAIAGGGDPYVSSLYPHDPYAYPPLAAEIVTLLDAAFGERTLIFVWPAISLAAYFGAMALMLRGFGPVTPWRWVLVISGLALLGRAVRNDLYNGQINFLIVLLFVAGLYFRNAKRPLLVATLWAVMINFKPFLGIIVALLLRRKEWKTAAATVGGSGALFALSFAPMLGTLMQSFHGWVEFTRYYANPAFSSHPNHQSFYSLFLRLFTNVESNPPWFTAPVLVPILVGIIALVILWFVLKAIPGDRFEPNSKEERAKPLVEAAIVLAAWMCISPTTEGDHLLLLAPGVVGGVYFANRRLRSGAANARLWLGAAIAWYFCLAVQLLPVRTFMMFVEHSTWAILRGPLVLISGYGGYCMLAAIILSALALCEDRRLYAASALSKSSE
jgi:hypothetical protein